MEYHEQACAIWLDRLGVPPALRHDLVLLAQSGSAYPENLARHGLPSVLPLITTAPFVVADVRDVVVSTIAMIGDSAAPTVIAILEDAIFDDYWAAWRRAGVADTGAVSNAMECARYVYARALEGLRDLVKRADAVEPWFTAAQRLGFCYRESHEAVLGFYGPAYNLVEGIRLRQSIASGVWVGMGSSVPTPPGIDLRATGWGRSLEQCQRHEDQESLRREDESRRAEFARGWLAGRWFHDHQRRKGDE